MSFINEEDPIWWPLMIVVGIIDIMVGATLWGF